MIKTQETVEMMNELGSKGYESLRQLGELQMSAWNGLMEKQMQAFNLVVDSAVAQVALVGEGKEPQELLRDQIELNRKLAEDVTVVTRESAELVQKAGEDIRGWSNYRGHCLGVDYGLLDNTVLSAKVFCLDLVHGADIVGEERSADHDNYVKAQLDVTVKF